MKWPSSWVATDCTSAYPGIPGVSVAHFTDFTVSLKMMSASFTTPFVAVE